MQGLSVERELPKWPVLLATGEDVGAELGREICLRTSAVYKIDSVGGDWNPDLARAYGTKFDAWGYLTFEERERLEGELDILDLEYLGNDRVTATRFEMPSGWCDWDGTIGTPGTYLDAKWPSLVDLNREWALIAETWPELRMTAQLVTFRDPAHSAALDTFAPFLTWDIEVGEVRLRREPGELLRRVELPRMPRRCGAEVGRGCSIETLRQAIAEARNRRGTGK